MSLSPNIVIIEGSVGVNAGGPLPVRYPKRQFTRSSRHMVVKKLMMVDDGLGRVCLHTRKWPHVDEVNGDLVREVGKMSGFDFCQRFDNGEGHEAQVRVPPCHHQFPSSMLVIDVIDPL